MKGQFKLIARKVHNYWYLEIREETTSLYKTLKMSKNYSEISMIMNVARQYINSEYFRLDEVTDMEGLKVYEYTPIRNIFEPEK